MCMDARVHVRVYLAMCTLIFIGQTHMDYVGRQWDDNGIRWDHYICVCVCVCVCVYVGQ